ncbi:MAG: hypothetical protein LJE62_00920 [Silicimonas sp.]|nr:hypothetical protein [Silicimonas sp.]
MNTKILLAAAAATTFAGAAAQAATDIGNVDVLYVNPNAIQVSSNGQSYTKLKSFGNAEVGMRVEYTAGGLDRIISWKVWPEYKYGFGVSSLAVSLESHAASKSYDVFQRPKEVGKNAAVTFPGHLLEPSAVSMCNMMAASLRSQGKSNTQIFGQDREVHFNVIANYQFQTNMGGEELFEVQMPKTQTVICKKWAGSQIPTGPQALANPLHVKKATMKLKEIALMNGTCAVELTTAISTNTAGATMKYRFKHSSGKLSPVFTTKTAGNKIAVVKHKWDVPNGAGAERGWMQLIGVSHDFKSNRARYRMQCQDSAVGGFAAGPKKPKVRVKVGGNGALSN